MYEKVDLVYSPSYFARKEGFTSAQSQFLSPPLLLYQAPETDPRSCVTAYMNVIESILNVGFLVASSQKSPVAILIGFSAVVMTAAKTILYWLVDQVCCISRRGASGGSRD